ncbi:MAG: signal peptidase I [Anaerolineae bacterium]|nr:signal peptidase I [Anaerolineae bacterium]MCO5195887.1 signal peptidase I [Anaerolineae bacterium]MCO5196849.1 signal peptidase I [Anaerolineae bacterium]
MSTPQREVPSTVVDVTLRQWAASAETNLIPVRGNSMKPLLHEGDVVRIEHGLRDIRRGDILVFRQHGGLVVHRCLRRAGDRAAPLFITKGDNVRHLDAPVAASDVLGRVLSMQRGEDMERALDTQAWRLFGRFLALFMLAWAIPYSRLREWKRERVGSRYYRPIQLIGDTLLAVSAAFLRVAGHLLNRRRS